MTMNTKLLALVSAFVLIASMPALAQTTAQNYDTPAMPTVTEQNVKDGVENTKEAVKDAVEDTTAAIKDTYDKISAALLTDETNETNVTHVAINPRMTATGILGKPIYNMAGQTLGKVEDIILNADGEARTVVVSHGGFLGVGSKLAAFDYDTVMRRESDGDVVMPVTKESMKTALLFSYNPADIGAKTRVMADGGVSVKTLLGGSLADSDGKIVALTDNIYFSRGYASRVIFSFDQSMGVGGEKVAMNFDALELSRSEDGYQFQMNEKQSLQFQMFRKIATN
jgi:sporulation protein YlmC with PRC-barrel domain